MEKKAIKTIYEWLERHGEKTKGFLYDPKVKEAFILLNPGTDGREKQKQFVLEKIKLCVLILLCGALLTCGLWINEKNQESIGDNIVVRSSFGEGSQKLELVASHGNEVANIPLLLEEKEFSHKELEEGYTDFLAKLKRVVLGENVSFELVSYNLSLVEAVEEYPFTISWTTDGDYVATDGRLLVEELENPQAVELKAKIAYRDFYREEQFTCLIYSRAVKKTFQEKVTESLQNLEGESRTEKDFSLPESLHGKDITWKKNIKHNAVLGVILVPLFVLVILFCKDQDLQKLVKERQEQMRYDYPQIVSKLALYIGAGMTIQNAWKKITEEYQKAKTKEMHFAYEEMIITLRELENGLSLGKALESFGKRCKSVPYMKLATLLTQHVKKGSNNVAELLYQESKGAFEERKQMVRQQGEKAGTKLLAPMMMLLFIIMIMILVPAFFNQIL